MAYALSDIIKKIRRLIKSPSTSQITDDEIKEYIDNAYVNHMVQFNIPNQFETFLTFYTKPSRGEYKISDVSDINDIYNIYPEAYVSGSYIYFYQNSENFYDIYSRTKTEYKVGDGDGSTISFSGTLENVPIIPNEVNVSAMKTGTDGFEYDKIEAYDDGSGGFGGDVSSGSINYDTGDFNFDLSETPSDGSEIYIYYSSYATGLPTAVLYYEDRFVFRPIPDNIYKVDIKVIKKPTSLSSQSGDPYPNLKEWWDLIAYGAAKDILLERYDEDKLRIVATHYEKLLMLANRRRLLRFSSETTNTIYN